jgi:hypothetical protein
MVASKRGPGPRIRDVRVLRSSLRVDLEDGRSLSVPLAWFPGLLRGSPAERGRWELCGGGTGIHWPDLDEDLSAEGLLRGAPAPRARGAGRKPDRPPGSRRRTGPRGRAG